jgi:hypothetical protein
MPIPLIFLEETRTNGTSAKEWVKSKASSLHEKVPGIKSLPFPAVAIIVLLLLINVAVWIVVGIVLVCDPLASDLVEVLID